MNFSFLWNIKIFDLNETKNQEKLLKDIKIYRFHSDSSCRINDTQIQNFLKQSKSEIKFENFIEIENKLINYFNNLNEFYTSLPLHVYDIEDLENVNNILILIIDKIEKFQNHNEEQIDNLINKIKQDITLTLMLEQKY